MTRFQYVAEYCDCMQALEAFDLEFELRYGTYATAATEGEISKLSKEYNKHLSELVVRANRAYADQDKEEALAVIDEMEKLFNEWKSKLRSLPKESAVLKTVLKIAAVAVGIVLVFKGIPSARKALVKKIFAKFPKVAASTGKQMAVKGGAMLADLVASDVIGGKVVSNIFRLFLDATAVRDVDDEYKNDANARNSTYVETLMILDASLDALKQMRSDVQSGNFGRGE